MRQKLQDAQGDNKVRYLILFMYKYWYYITDICKIKWIIFWFQILRSGGFVKDCINTILTSSDSKEELIKNLEIIHSKVCIF